MSRKSNVVVESTFMRFEVEVNIPGYPEDDGDALAKEVAGAIRTGIMKFHPKTERIDIREITE